MGKNSPCLAPSSCWQLAFRHETVEDRFFQVSLMRKMISDSRDICRPRSVLVSVIGQHDHAARNRVPKHPVVVLHRLISGESKVEQQLAKFLVRHFSSHG